MNNILYIFFSWKGNIKNCYERIVNMMSNLNYEHYIIVTGGEKETYIDISKKRLYIKCNDFYEGLPEKVLETFKYLYKNGWCEKYDYFCKIDDDIIIRKILKLEKNIVHFTGRVMCAISITSYEQETKKIHGARYWHINKCTPGSYHNKKYYSGKYVDFCGGGYGYILSKHAIEKLKNEEITKEDIYEDLAIALLLKKKGITPTKTNKTIWNNHIFSPEHSDTENNASSSQKKSIAKLN